MNTHQRWAKKMMAKPMPLAVEIERAGADRERRRIRRTQMDALEGVRLLLAKLDATADLDAAIALTGVLDAATRAKKGKRK